MEELLIKIVFAALTYLAAEIHQIFTGSAPTFTGRVFTKPEFTLPAVGVVILTALTLTDGRLRTDKCLVLAFFAWAVVSHLGALYDKRYEGVRPWLFVVPTGTTTLVGALLIIVVNVWRIPGVLHTDSWSYGLVFGGTIISMIAFLAVSAVSWYDMATRPTFVETRERRVRTTSIAGLLSACLVLAFVVFITSTPETGMAAEERPIETTEVQVQYMSLEARDGVSILRFSTDNRGQEDSYTVRADTPMADLVGLSEHLRVRYRVGPGRDREVVDLEVLPRP